MATDDHIEILLNDSMTVRSAAPAYPVAEYFQDQGDAISSGFVYRGTRIPALNGKYVFGDITTGRLFYCDVQELISAHDSDPATLAPVHELQVIHQGAEKRVFDIVAAKYAERGGTARALPGGADVTRGNDPYGVPYGFGRADIRLALDGDGELYLLSKSDGMVRRFLNYSDGPTPIHLKVLLSGDGASITVEGAPGTRVMIERTTRLDQWADWRELQLTNDSTPLTDFLKPGEERQFYRAKVLP